MIRFNSSFVVFLSALLWVSVCSAQQVRPPATADGGADPSHQIGQSFARIGQGYVPLYLGPNSFIDSIIYQATGGNVGIGTTTPVATLDVNGGINTATSYNIIGSPVLSIGTPADNNLFIGVDAGLRKPSRAWPEHLRRLLFRSQ